MGLKKWMIASVVAGAASGAAIWLKDETRREKVSKVIQDSYQKVSNKVTSGHEKTTEELGNPLPESEDSKMVDEGAMYSVKHYNEKQQLNQS